MYAQKLERSDIVLNCFLVLVITSASSLTGRTCRQLRYPTRLARLAAPHNCCLALIGDTYFLASQSVTGGCHIHGGPWMHQ